MSAPDCLRYLSGDDVRKGDVVHRAGGAALYVVVGIADPTAQLSTGVLVRSTRRPSNGRRPSEYYEPVRTLRLVERAS